VQARIDAVIGGVRNAVPPTNVTAVVPQTAATPTLPLRDLDDNPECTAVYVVTRTPV